MILEKLMSKYRCTAESTRQSVTSSSLNDDSAASADALRRSGVS